AVDAERGPPGFDALGRGRWRQERGEDDVDEVAELVVGDGAHGVGGHRRQGRQPPGRWPQGFRRRDQASPAQSRRRSSYSAMAVAVATLSDPTRPSWGMYVTRSQAARVAAGSPRSSWPMARHTGPLTVSSGSGTASSVSSRPMTQ